MGSNIMNKNLFINNQTPAIAMLVIKNGEIVHKNVVGAAQLNKNSDGLIANNNTAFSICSMTKHITAAAILYLEEANKLCLTDTIGCYISNLPPNISGTTIIELLFHISGIENYTNLPELHQIDNNVKHNIIFDKEKIYSYLSKLKVSESKGSFSYTNTGYFLLSLLIEQVSGQKYFDFLKSTIFRNITLSNTYMIDEHINHSNYAEPYSSWPLFTPTKWMRTIQPLGEGGLMMSINDFANWIIALTTNNVFKNPKTLKKYLNIDNHNNIIADGIYHVGYGLFHNDEYYNDKQYKITSHAGAMIGSSSLFGRIVTPESNEYWVAYFSNSLVSLKLFDILDMNNIML